ncbi:MULTISPECIES: GGDEF domain-containing protein [unclassified Actinoplanes]|uniref:GGDEF domain-containing protein n=1 Tax=unclassified Actinoplanes TaxID=2626549 RepID=UPI0012F7B133|nr:MULTISPECIES: GGDEF domain-containing protein [unclassified Actinoplanes]
MEPGGSADPFFLGLYPACAAGIALLIRRRDEWRNGTALVDAATITIGFGLLAWVFVIEPAHGDIQMDRLAYGTQVAYPIGDLLLIAMMTRLVRGRGARGPALAAMVAALGALLVGDSSWVIMDNLGGAEKWLGLLPWLGRALESVFVTAFALFAVAALDPGAGRLAEPAQERSARLGPGLLALLTGASLIAPGLLAGQLHSGSVKNGWSIVLCSTTLFLLVVVRMAGLVREVERQARQVRDLARSDELTGLPNRRAWNDELPRALERARRDHQPVVVAIVDLDHFKRFNDTYGHPAGDRLLKAASAAWHETLRKADLLARYGGEEFVVLLPGSDAAHGHGALSRMLAATPQGQTFSAGLAVWDGQETSDELLQRADQALYLAKERGRNRIEMPAAA